MKQNKMKNCIKIIISLFVFLVFGCKTHLIDDIQQEELDYQVDSSQSLIISGEISFSDEFVFGRSAFSSCEFPVLYYKLIATNADSTTITATLKQDSINYIKNDGLYTSTANYIISIPLTNTPVNWTITVEAYESYDDLTNDYSNLLCKGSKELTVDFSTKINKNLNINVYPLELGPGETGIVYLPIKIISTEIKGMKAVWKQNGISYTETIAIGDHASETTIIFDMIDDGGNNDYGVPAGSYEVAFSFYDNAACSGTQRYSCIETINVIYGNIAGLSTGTVDTWIKHSALGSPYLKLIDSTKSKFIAEFVITDELLYEVDNGSPGGAIGPNGGNANSEYTVISTIEACGDIKPTVAGVYSVSTEAELKKIATWVNEDPGTGAVGVFEDFTFVLYDNIILTEDWVPIGKYNSTLDMKCFKGTIDGNGNSISNLIINDINLERAGFIKCSLGTTVKNLSLNGSIKAKGTTGAFVGYSYGDMKLENCINNVTIEATGNNYAGGLVGYIAGSGSNVRIRNCINNKNVTGAQQVGGIVGGTASNVSYLEIINCLNLGDISGTRYVGGIAGRPVPNGLTITNCVTCGNSSASLGSDYGYLIGATAQSYSGGVVLDYCYYLDGVCVSDKAVGSSTGATYTYGEHFASFTTNGVVSVLENAVLSTTDLLTSLNNWIDNPSLGNDSAHSKYKTWYYDENGYPSFTQNSSGGGAGDSISDLTAAPIDGSYTMNTLAEFDKINTWLESGVDLHNVTIKLTGDIPEGNTAFKSIGTATNPFTGTFDGNGCTVHIKYTDGTDNGGLFGYVKNATIKNVHVTGPITQGTHKPVGGIVGVILSNSISDVTVIDNCSVDATFTLNSGMVGGIVGQVSGGSVKITNCLNEMNNQLADQQYIGGIVGFCSAEVSKLEIYNCGNRSSVKALSSGGGIIGQSNCGKTFIKNCFNHNTQCLEDVEKKGGAIIGYLNISETTELISNCYAYEGNNGSSVLFGSCASENYDAATCLSYTINDGKPTVTPVVVDSEIRILDNDNAANPGLLNQWVNEHNAAAGSNIYRLWTYDGSGVIDLAD